MKALLKSVPVVAGLVLWGCGGSDPGARVEADAANAPATVESSASLPAEAATVLTLEDGENAARYRVREQLVNVDLPNDAVGTTTRVSGRIVLDQAGNVLPEASSVLVDVSALESDRDRRDGYIRGRVLRADEYPTVRLEPTAVRGLPSPLPTSGTHTFELVGDLTVLDVTRSTTWHVSASFDGRDVEGTAVTRFTFDDFALSQPRVPVVLSVADTIALEIDFGVVARPPEDE
jgi:polyisoprenoid-binding protein YceI